MKSNIIFSWVCILLYILFWSAISYLSKQFVWGVGYLERPVILFTSIYLLCWVIFSFFFFRIRKVSINKRNKTSSIRINPFNSLAIIIFLGLLIRSILLPSNPILESDFYRYIWEGNIQRVDLNPYERAPKYISSSKLSSLNKDQNKISFIKERVSFDHVKTIYPPLAQYLFKLEAYLFGFNPLGFRFFFLIVDFLILLIGLMVLQKLRMPLQNIALYWLNPLILKEITNSMHLDILCAFSLILFALFLLKSRTFAAGMALLSAILIKLTPIIMVPSFIIYVFRKRKFATLVIGLLSAFLVSIMFANHFFIGVDKPFQGVQIFSGQWETNSLFFFSIRELIEFVFELKSGSFRGLLNTFFLLSVTLFLTIIAFKKSSKKSILSSLFYGLIVLFILSPVGNPWYLVWVTPLFIIFPSFIFLFLQLMVSLYYFEFHLMYHNQGNLFLFLWIIEFIPVYTIITYKLYLKFKIKKGLLHEGYYRNE